jgi:hypothetical protein
VTVLVADEVGGIDLGDDREVSFVPHLLDDAAHQCLVVIEIHRRASSVVCDGVPARLPRASAAYYGSA